MRLNQRYEIQRELAQGSDTKIYQAHDHLKDWPVFIKEFFPSALQDWKLFQLIEREAKILAQINHIQIPDFIDFFTRGAGSEQHLYLVTEWVKGESLEDKLEGGWRPDLQTIQMIADQVLQLLVYLHAFHPPIVHRDIKPNNLMLSPFNRVYLVDFGGVQEHMESQGAGGSTLVGTVGYMAPEQMAGRAVPATDLYALGITLLQLSLNQDPQFIQAQLESQGLKSVLPDIPENWRVWLELLTEPNLENRQQSAQVALADLDLLRDRDPEARTLFFPTDHKARLPEILHSLTLIERTDNQGVLKEGSILKGQYTVEKLLGSGTHSRVYRGKNLKTQQAVILKELSLAQVTDWKNLTLFEREMETLASLEHRRIPRFVDGFKLGEGEGLCWYLVSEAVDGETLEAKLERGWRPTDGQIWQMACEMLEILAYLQNKQPPLVHRDIKPSNLIVDTEGQMHLIDFGAVQDRFWSQGGGGSTIIGTFGYMAPEQFMGQAQPQTDLYGLGACLVRLLSLRHPIEIPMTGRGLDFRPFIQADPFYLFWLDHCLHPDVNQRFAHASEALELLEAHRQGKSQAQKWLEAQHFEAEASLELNLNQNLKKRALFENLQASKAEEVAAKQRLEAEKERLKAEQRAYQEEAQRMMEAKQRQTRELTEKFVGEQNKATPLFVVDNPQLDLIRDHALIGVHGEEIALALPEETTFLDHQQTLIQAHEASNLQAMFMVLLLLASGGSHFFYPLILPYLLSLFGLMTLWWGSHKARILNKQRQGKYLPPSLMHYPALQNKLVPASMNNEMHYYTATALLISGKVLLNRKELYLQRGPETNQLLKWRVPWDKISAIDWMQSTSEWQPFFSHPLYTLSLQFKHPIKVNPGAHSYNRITLFMPLPESLARSYFQVLRAYWKYALTHPSP